MGSRRRLHATVNLEQRGVVGVVVAIVGIEGRRDDAHVLHLRHGSELAIATGARPPPWLPRENDLLVSTCLSSTTGRTSGRRRISRASGPLGFSSGWRAGTRSASCRPWTA